MKLIDRYNRISLLVTIAIIIVTGFVYYLTISYILTNRVDRDLVVEENEIFAYVKLNDKLPQVFKSDGLKIRFTASATDSITRTFGNTLFYNEEENEQEAGRMLTSSVKVEGKTYRIEITESKVETEYLIRFIFFITLGIILVLLTLLLIINRILVRRLWKPFYRILEGIKLFNVADKNGIHPVASNIDEFRDLNMEVTAMSGRVMNDYQSLKGFVENAAHELMTPLAVINSKLDTLMQVGEMTDKQGAIISEVYDTVGRLKKLNRSMLLLSRIENKLLAEPEIIDLLGFIEHKISEFHELLAERDIVVNQDLQPCQVTINRDLLTVMLNNLLGNAILHNIKNGNIGIRLNKNELLIANTGSGTALNEQKVLQRFYKSSESEGSGLGLTLVKEICDNYGYVFNYNFKDGLHAFEIKFQ
ncbi:MAG: HAMP domain-containing histidine kinase [Mucilaginibacter sp.]|nr:HAMP domain-containing histidine kinase [Mucilaginibacter sp.]